MKKCKACGENRESVGKIRHETKQLATANETLEAQLDEFWAEVDRRFDMEGRAELEEYAARVYGHKKYALSAAVHYMWKRDPKVAELEARATAAEARLGMLRGVMERKHTWSIDSTDDKSKLASILGMVDVVQKDMDSIRSILSDTREPIATKASWWWCNKCEDFNVWCEFDGCEKCGTKMTEVDLIVMAKREGE